MSGTRDLAQASGRAPVPVPDGRRARNTLATDEGEIDEAFFNAISRSLPSVSSALEPELEPAMLRPESPQESTSHTGSVLEDGYISEDETETNDATAAVNKQSQTEESPLLRRRPSQASQRREQSYFRNNTSPGRFWLIFSQVLLALFISCFDGTLLASSHPVITSHFGAANAASWLSTSFLLTSTAFQPLLGRMSDGLGRKPLFIGCLWILTAGTAWCGLAWSIESFIVARAVCGLGAGGASAMGSIIVSDLVPIERRGTYQSIINAVYGSGAALGAAMGGALAESIGWRWAFGIQVAPLLICAGISWVTVPRDIGIQDKRGASLWQILKAFDSKGSLLLTTAVTFFILGLNLGGNILKWSHPFIIASLVIAATAFPTFLWVESRAEKPIMPPRLISTAPHANLIFSNFIGAILANAILFNMPLYFQAVLLTSATSSGLRLVVPSIVASIVGTSTGFAITYTRRLKWPLMTATTFYIISSICLVLLRRSLPSAIYVLALFPNAIGTGFQFPGTFMALLTASPQAEQAVVTSTLLLWRNIGNVLGVATSSLIVQNVLMYYLGIYVHGDMRDEVIERVKESVEAVARLEQPYREQAIQSYEAALRLTFVFCMVVAVVSFCLTAVVRLPRLPSRK